ncbi:MAG: phosphatidylserine/phosphatidylglycerophosphate/cardiolipin synthase family protein [Deltaproteobacteria bacterium]|nr:phosphatidylserine/phosphatidylglycerophosphate/cardiolipin synthase family protein [Deltaproteobacteria bacterium]
MKVTGPKRSAPPPPADPAARGAAASPSAARTPRPDGFSGGTPAAPGPLLAPLPARTVPALPRFCDPAFEAALDAATFSRARPGNNVQLLQDGAESFPARDALIDGAKQSICLQTFIFDSDETGWALARRLAQKAKDGVKVRVIYDAVGSQRADPALFEHLRQAGVEVRAYGQPWKVWDLNDRWHEKHLVVDGRAAITGGMNIANEYAYGGSGRAVLSRGKVAEQPWRDVDVKLTGPVVGDAARAFIRNWELLGDALPGADRSALLPRLSPAPGGHRVRLVQADPEAETAGRTTALYLEAIRHARRSITLENAYFVPPEEVRTALVEAARRGVEVRVLTNSRASTDFGVVSDAGRYFYDALVHAGVKVYETTGGTLHGKVATFDGEFSIVGSVNLNGRSAHQDTEVAAAIDDGGTASALVSRFEAGLRQARQVTAAELEHEGFLANLRQWAVSSFAWML